MSTSAESSSSSSGPAREPKVPKGTRDFNPIQMAVREKAMNTITSCFKRHGALTIDTPVFELKETLTGKYGEDSKLIYDLADQGGEMLSLRYDLTVPFARFVAMHNITKMKRYCIGKVYRRDNPVMSRGRFREFYQCDYDIAGFYDKMLPDADCLKVLVEILSELPIGPFEIKLNHRKLLDGIFEICKVPESSFRAISSAVDKLDKSPWSEVREEIIQKGMPEEVAESIGTFVLLKGKPNELLAQLKNENKFTSSAIAKQGLEDLELLFGYLDVMGVLDRIVFDLSLARGLDYYTGVIFEAVLTDSTKGIGSIAGGGRYDNLVGMFHSQGKQIPSVGMSVGIERVFAIMEENEKGLREVETEVLVAGVGGNTTAERLKICKELWQEKIKAEFLYFNSVKFKEQIEIALDRKIPFLVIIGEAEAAEGVVQIKDVVKNAQSKVQRKDMISYLKNALRM